MKTLLDECGYQEWYIEGFTYKDKVLFLDVARARRSGASDMSPRYVVIFSDVGYFQAYDEIAHLPEHSENRSGGVIAKHHSSSLMNFLEVNTAVLNGPGEYSHYSVMTGDEFVHVVTRTEPKVLAVS